MYSTDLPTTPDTVPDVIPAFNIVVAYEDFETGKKAKQSCDRLAHGLSEEFQVNQLMWKFDVLAIPKLREIAANDAARADIIIISCHGSLDLPPAVVAWIDSWRQKRPEAIALVALCHCPPENSLALRNYLAQAVRGSNMEFFAEPDDWPGNGRSVAGALSLRNHRWPSGHIPEEAGVPAGFLPRPV